MKKKIRHCGTCVLLVCPLCSVQKEVQLKASLGKFYDRMGIESLWSILQFLFCTVNSKGEAILSYQHL
jgi:hypothetical protein